MRLESSYSLISKQWKATVIKTRISIDKDIGQWDRIEKQEINCDVLHKVKQYVVIPPMLHIGERLILQTLTFVII